MEIRKPYSWKITSIQVFTANHLKCSILDILTKFWKTFATVIYF